MEAPDGRLVCRLACIFASRIVLETWKAGMGISPATRDYRTFIAAASLIVGPLLMIIGDLFRPEERMDPAEQIANLDVPTSDWPTKLFEK
jgi:hypothetical protein